MKHFIYLIIFSLLHSFAIGQKGLISQKKNQTDAKGLKQGYWEKKYKNGQYAYQVHLVDGMPIGEMKRFHSNGKQKAILVYDKKKYATAQLFDDNGLLTSTGYYNGKTKDSTWTYYSTNKDKRLTETYRNGKLAGKVIVYYNDSTVAEETSYTQGQKDGLWRQYYPNGRTYLESRYIKGIRDGVFNQYHESGRFMIKGHYVNNLKDGKWEYFDAKGKLTHSINYVNGSPDQESLEREHEFLKKQEEPKPGLLDPKNFTNNPMEYMRKSGIR